MSPDGNNNEALSLLGFAVSLGQKKIIALLIVMGFACLGLLYAFTATPIFTAKTIIMPPQQQQSSAAAAMASLGALAGVSLGSGQAKTLDELYLALLKSNSLIDDLVYKHDLIKHYKAKTKEIVRLRVLSAASARSDKKSGLITIEYRDKDPAFAAKLANGYVESLRVLLTKLAVTEAQQRRLFFEMQIKKVQNELANSEINFRELNSKGGLPITDVVAQVSVTASATLRGQIAAKEVELGSLRSFATSNNPEVLRISGEISALRNQLNKVEQGGGGNGHIQPEGHAAIQALRSVKSQQATLEALIKSYEIARIDESREAPLIQQIDIAQPPESRTSPRRFRILMLSLIAGVIVSLTYVWIGYYSAGRKSGMYGENLKILLDAWIIRRH